MQANKLKIQNHSLGVHLMHSASIAQLKCIKFLHANSGIHNSSHTIYVYPHA